MRAVLVSVEVLFFRHNRYSVIVGFLNHQIYELVNNGTFHKGKSIFSKL